MRIVFPKVLSPAVGDRLTLEVTASTVDHAIAAMLDAEPAVAVHLFDSTGALRPHVLCFVDGEATRLEDRGATLSKTSEIRFLQAVSGGFSDSLSKRTWLV